MILSQGIKKDMQYPSPEVKARCLTEVARYLLNAYKCGVYSEVLDKLVFSKYFFNIDSEELMELLSNRYKCKEICDKANLLKEMYAEKYGLINMGNSHIPMDYEFICKHVFDKKIDCDNLTYAEIDLLAEGVEVKKIPGILYPLMCISYDDDNEEVFLYIYTKYVLPAYVKLSETGDLDRYEALNTIMCGYIEELISYVTGLGQVFITSIPRNTTWNEVIMEFQNSGEFECIKQAGEKLKNTTGIGMQLLEFHKKNKKRLKKMYQTYMINYYPMFTALVLFALLGEEKNEQAVEFMIDNYSDMSEGNRQRAYVLMLLFKTILLADNYEYMNILYADLQKEKVSYQRSFKDINDLIMKSCELIEELYEKTCMPQENKYFEDYRCFIKEIVFEKWGVLQDVRNIRNQYKYANDISKADMFQRVYIVIKSLSDREGINVALIGQTYGQDYRFETFIKEKHHNNKVSMVISWDDVERAENLLTHLGEIDTVAISIRNRSFFDRVDFIIKDILLQKLDDDIESMLTSIRELREKTNYTNKEDKFFTAIETSINSLAKRVSAKYIDREQIVSYFIKLDANMGCWDNLDEECRNMMITSEIVYRTLVARADADKLDYSPAMIPLTKVMESLLNGIFNMIKSNIVFSGPAMNIDTSSIDYYKERNANTPKDSLEMGPAIKMLSDGFLKINNGTITYGSSYLPGRSRFAEWQGNRYVDWDRLEDFKGIMLNCSGFKANSPTGQFVLGSNAELNRKIFIGALEYIKNCYRNKVAHKDGINRSRIDDCRQNMLIAQKLIWMLIYIIK